MFKSRSFLMFSMLYAISVTVLAKPYATVTIDAAQDCFNTLVGGVYANSVAYSPKLPAGEYVLTGVSNNMNCSYGSPAPRCAIDTVIVQAASRWGMAMKEDTVISVPTDNYPITFYVTDTDCHDNVGTAVINIYQVTK